MERHDAYTTSLAVLYVLKHGATIDNPTAYLRAFA